MVCAEAGLATSGAALAVQADAARMAANPRTSAAMAMTMVRVRRIGCDCDAHSAATSGRDVVKVGRRWRDAQ